MTLMKRIVRVRTCTSLEEMELKYIFVNKQYQILFCTLMDIFKK